MRAHRLLRRLALALPLLAGCAAPDEPPDSGMEEPLPVPAGCNPVAYEHDCLLPYPSDFFLGKDASLPSGRRVALTEAATPRTRGGAAVDFLPTHPVDGFSPDMPILAYFESGVSTDGVVFHTDDPAASITPTSKVLLLDAETGQAVPAWGEVDRNTDTPSEQAFIVRPFQRLENRRRYIVALQGLKDPAGAPLQAPKGFARLRDGRGGRPGNDAALQALQARYDAEVFPVLERLGVKRADLQLAWDFTTASEEVSTRDMLAVREAVLAKMKEAPPAVTIGKVTEKPVADNAEIWLRVEGTIRVPLYLESAEPGAKLKRDAMGRVVQNGEADVPFTLQVPQSAKPADGSFEPARILEYGHGFFGLREEINYGYMRGYSNEQRTVTVAVDWWGMSEADLDLVTRAAAAAPGQAFDFVDRLHQAMANMIALSYAVKGPLAAAPELQRFGKTLYDPSKLYYYGISQGAIFGVTLLSLSPQLDRGALSVGGGAYSLMMSRSASYAMLYQLLTSVLPDPLAVQKFTALSQSTWDRVDPMTYARHLLREPYPGSPPDRHVLMQIGIGDHSVNNLASHLLARAVGIPLLDPAPQKIWGLQGVTGPTDDALVVVDFKLTDLPGIYCKIPAEPDKTDVHEGVRRNVKIKQQLDLFFQPSGVIRNTCDGPCDPE